MLASNAASPRIVTVILAASPQPSEGSLPAEREGESLVSRLAVAAIASRSAEVAVVTGARRYEIEADVAGAGVTCLYNACHREGLASSLRIAACWAVQRRCDGLILFGLDQPHVSGSHIDRLVDAFELHRGRVASYFGGAPDLPGVFPRSDLGALLSLRGAEAARGLLGGDDVWLVPFPGGRVEAQNDVAPPWIQEAGLRDMDLDDLRYRSKHTSGVHSFGPTPHQNDNASWPLRLRRA